MPYEYVRFTSHNSPLTSTDSRYTINLPKPIQNAVSAHVKSFSMPNTAFNVNEGNNLLEWYEYDDSTGTISINSASLPDTKFYSIGELLADISTAVSAETSLFEILLTQIASSVSIDTYHTNLNLTNDVDDNDKFCPIVVKGSIWEMIGFRPNFLVNPVHHGRVTPSLVIAHITNPIVDSADTRWLAGSLSGVNHVSQFPPRDSHESYHITSSLATAVYEAEADGVARHTNYLLTIPNSSNRYSWIQYIPTEPVFHELSGQTLSSFTIGLADENGFPMKCTEHQVFSVVIAIEYRDLHQTLEANQLRTLEWRRSHC